MKYVGEWIKIWNESNHKIIIHKKTNALKFLFPDDVLLNKQNNV